MTAATLKWRFITFGGDYGGSEVASVSSGGDCGGSEVTISSFGDDYMVTAVGLSWRF